MGHIRLLSRLHCAMRRARSVCRIMKITTFRKIVEVKQNEEAHLSDAASSLSAVVPELLMNDRPAFI